MDQRFRAARSTSRMPGGPQLSTHWVPLLAFAATWIAVKARMIAEPAAVVVTILYPEGNVDGRLLDLRDGRWRFSMEPDNPVLDDHLL